MDARRAPTAPPRRCGEPPAPRRQRIPPHLPASDELGELRGDLTLLVHDTALEASEHEVRRDLSHRAGRVPMRRIVGRAGQGEPLPTSPFHAPLTAIGAGPEAFDAGGD